jgi:hypothetical protein
MAPKAAGKSTKLGFDVNGYIETEEEEGFECLPCTMPSVLRPCALPLQAVSVPCRSPSQEQFTHC